MDAPPQIDEVMTYSHRLLAMAIGSVSSLCAIGYKLPSTVREASIRFLAGSVCAFSGTGFAITYIGLKVNTDTVLAVGLILGSIGWGILGALITLSENGYITTAIKHWVQGKLPPEPPKP